LSAETGYSIVYTAPNSNENCELNPTINLICLDNVVDSLTIAVNIYIGGEEALITFTGSYCYCVNEMVPLWNCGLTETHLRCDGVLIGDPAIRAEQNNSCDLCNNETIATLRVDAPKTITHALEVNPLDKRTEAMILAGCCPEDLI